MEVDEREGEKASPSAGAAAAVEQFQLQAPEAFALSPKRATYGKHRYHKHVI